MKTKSLFQPAFALLMLLCVSLTAQGKKTPIASLVQNQGDYTLLFEYKDISGENFDSMHQWKDNDILNTDNPGWQTFHDKITKVVFSPDFAQVQPTTLKKWFQNFSKLTSIEGLEYLNTSKVKSMESTFDGCTELTSVKGKFNCANDTTLKYMFMNCKKLNSIDMSDFTNTSKVEDMSAMFYGCESLRSLIFPESFDSSNVKLMFMLFQRCNSLSQLDISHFNTDKATDMRYMFADCENLETIDVASFRTDNVTKMYGMFMDCRKLKELNLCNFNTDNVTDMNYMFYNCNCLTTIYCNEAWNTTAQSVSMFFLCYTLSGAIDYDQDKIDNNYANPTDGYFTAEKVIDYKIKIAGVPVTNLNCKDLTGITGVNVVDGHLSYDPETNTLLIDEANIGGGENPAIECNNSGLTIKVGRGRSMGYNTLTSTSAPVLKILKKTTIKGDPKLWMLQNDGGLYLDGPIAIDFDDDIYANLTIDNALVYAKGSRDAIVGGVRNLPHLNENFYYYYGSLTIKGVSNVQIYGTYGCILDIAALYLEGYNTILSPRPWYFKEAYSDKVEWTGLCYYYGGLVKDETVYIAYFNPADVNLDQEVNISDVVAVINTMAGDKTFENTADVNSDNDVNISDVVMVINVMAGGEVPLPKAHDAASREGYCPDSDHPHVIDMGDAGKWSCCNVGAYVPWQYGGYYAWGETFEKSTYDFSYYTLWDWNLNMPQILGDIKGNTAYDVAAKEWGGNWRMPNSPQTVNLYNNVKSIKKVTLKGVNGMKITAANGNAIFIPFGGYMDGSVKKDVDEVIYLWSSTQADPMTAFILVSNGSAVGFSANTKGFGLNVRPVAE